MPPDTPADGPTDPADPSDPGCRHHPPPPAIGPARPLLPPDSSPTSTAPADRPRPPVAAYYSLVDALEAIDNDPVHEHCHMVCRTTYIKFLDIRDHGCVTAGTRRPNCLVKEMEKRGAIRMGTFIEGVNDAEVSVPCPTTIEGMGWGW